MRELKKDDIIQKNKPNIQLIPLQQNELSSDDSLDQMKSTVEKATFHWLWLNPQTLMPNFWCLSDFLMGEFFEDIRSHNPTTYKDDIYDAVMVDMLRDQEIDLRSVVSDKWSPRYGWETEGTSVLLKGSSP